jgi:exopolysaccharide production protein ExoQ
VLALAIGNREFKATTLEWYGASLVMLLLSGAIFPFVDRDGILDASDQSILKLLALPIYSISAILLVNRSSQTAQAVRMNMAYCLVLVIALGSVAWSVAATDTLQRAIALIGSSLFSFALAICFTPREIARMTAGILGLCMVASLAMAVAQPARAFEGFEHALRGIYPNKNALGWLTVYSCIMCATVVADRTCSWRRRAFGLLVASIICLVASKSMTAMISIFCSCLAAAFFLVLNRVRGLQRVVFVMIVMQVLVTVYFVVGTYLGPLLEAVGKDPTLTGRVPLWQAIDASIAQRMLFGYGYQAFWSDGSAMGWSVRMTAGWPAPNAHHGLRDILLGIGLVGFLPALVFIVNGVRLGMLRLMCEPRAGWTSPNVLVIAFLGMNLTESLLFTPNSLLFILFTTACISFAVRRGLADRRSN